MKRSILRALCAALAIGWSGGAAAEDGDVSVSLSAGTLGVGPELGLRFSDTLGARLGANALALSGEADVDGIDYDGDLDLRSAGAMLDWHPFASGFRVSAGARWNGTELDLSARPSAPVEIGGVVFTPAQIGMLEGTVELRSFAPAISVGFAGEPQPGLTLGLEFGVLYQGVPELRDLRARGGLLANDPNFLARLRAEEDEVEDELDRYRLWPIVQLLVVYRF